MVQLSVSPRAVRTVLVLALLGVVWPTSADLLASEGLVCAEFSNAGWNPPAHEVRTLRDLSIPLLGHDTTAADRAFSVSCEGWLYVPTPGSFTFLLSQTTAPSL